MRPHHVLLLACLCGCVVEIVADTAADDEDQDCPHEHAFCNDMCIDVHEDLDNCGDCDVVCGNDEICHDSHCECRVGFDRCNDVCVDPDIDPENCGQCGLTCQVGQVCVAKQCVAP